MHKLVLYGISENMYAIVQNGKYDAINTADPTTMGYYVVKLLSKPYTLQDDKKMDNHVIKVVDLIVNSEYLSIMKANTNWYCKQLVTRESVIIVTHKIIHTF